MPSAAPSSRIWVDLLLTGAEGASSVLVWRSGSLESLVEYGRYAGAMALTVDGRRAGASSLDPIDRGRADIVGVLWKMVDACDRDVDVQSMMAETRG
jgi:hypothetical protein